MRAAARRVARPVTSLPPSSARAIAVVAGRCHRADDEETRAHDGERESARLVILSGR